MKVGSLRDSKGEQAGMSIAHNAHNTREVTAQDEEGASGRGDNLRYQMIAWEAM